MLFIRLEDALGNRPGVFGMASSVLWAARPIASTLYSSDVTASSVMAFGIYRMMKFV